MSGCPLHGICSLQLLSFPKVSGTGGFVNWQTCKEGSFDHRVTAYHPSGFHQEKLTTGKHCIGAGDIKTKLKSVYSPLVFLFVEPVHYRNHGDGHTRCNETAMMLFSSMSYRSAISCFCSFNNYFRPFSFSFSLPTDRRNPDPGSASTRFSRLHTSVRVFVFIATRL